MQLASRLFGIAAVRSAEAQPRPMSEARTEGPRRKRPLHQKLLIGFVAGLALGLIAWSLKAHAPSAWVELEPFVSVLSTYGTRPVATIFLRLIFMLVLPLVFSALVVGVAEMSDVHAFARIARRALVYTALMSALAVALGLVMVNVFRPGAGVDEALAHQVLRANAERARGIAGESGAQPGGLDLLLSIVPDNVIGAASSNTTILSVMFFALMFGIGLMLTRTEGAAALTRGIRGMFEASMTLMNLVIRMAPYAVGCLVFDMALVFGWQLLGKLAGYVAVVVASIAIHLFVTYSLALRFIGGWSPLAFFRCVREAMLLAFTTASSNATLPTALRVADEELHLPRRVSRFVLTVGATANQNGTALFEGITVIFLAQFFGVELLLTQQLLVMGVCILGGIGTAGVPSGSLPIVAMICAMVGVNPEGIGLILGVNHFLDMCRTTLNVTGDLAIAAMVSRGEDDAPAMAEPGPPARA